MVGITFSVPEERSHSSEILQFLQSSSLHFRQISEVVILLLEAGGVFESAPLYTIEAFPVLTFGLGIGKLPLSLFSHSSTHLFKETTLRTVI